MTELPKPPKRGPKPRARIPRKSERWAHKVAASTIRRARGVTQPSPRKALEHRAYLLWREIVRAKMPSGLCYRCQSRRWVDCAHGWIKGKYRHLEYETSNGLPLCRTCHTIVDSDHEAKRELWTRHLGAAGYDVLRVSAIGCKVKLDMQLVVLALEAEGRVR